MTIYDKGLLRAMKAAYKDSGYTVDRQKIFKHEAQVAWNQEERHDGDHIRRAV